MQKRSPCYSNLPYRVDTLASTDELGWVPAIGGMSGRWVRVRVALLFEGSEGGWMGGRGGNSPRIYGCVSGRRGRRGAAGSMGGVGRESLACGMASRHTTHSTRCEGIKPPFSSSPSSSLSSSSSSSSSSSFVFLLSFRVPFCTTLRCGFLIHPHSWPSTQPFFCFFHSINRLGLPSPPLFPPPNFLFSLSLSLSLPSLIIISRW